MNFRIADTFTDSLTRLTGDEQKALFDAEDKFRSGNSAPYDFIIVDESQDMGVPEMRFLAALGSLKKDSLFFAGDLGQRIFQQPL